MMVASRLVFGLAFAGYLASALLYVARLALRRAVAVRAPLAGAAVGSASTCRSAGSLGAHGLWPGRRRGAAVGRRHWRPLVRVRTGANEQFVRVQVRRQGVRPAPFYAELLGHRAIDREAFMQGLLRAGPKAVAEFIQASTASRGEAAARPLRDWWDSRKPSA